MAVEQYLKTDYYYQTSDLVIIALCSALGGVFSVYISYISKFVGELIPLPSGGGQFMSGLHVFWLVLAYILTRKIGASLIAGITKGLVELLMGSRHGLLVVFFSGVQGLILEIFIILIVVMRVDSKDNISKFLLILAGAGFAGVSSFIISQILFYKGLPIELIPLVALVSFASGAFFGGHLGIGIGEMFLESGLLAWRPQSESKIAFPKMTIMRLFLLSIMVGLGLFFVLYYIPNVLL